MLDEAFMTFHVSHGVFGRFTPSCCFSAKKVNAAHRNAIRFNLYDDDDTGSSVLASTVGSAVQTTAVQTTASSGPTTTTTTGQDTTGTGNALTSGLGAALSRLSMANVAAVVRERQRDANRRQRAINKQLHRKTLSGSRGASSRRRSASAVASRRQSAQPTSASSKLPSAQTPIGGAKEGTKNADDMLHTPLLQNAASLWRKKAVAVKHSDEVAPTQRDMAEKKASAEAETSRFVPVASDAFGGNMSAAIAATTEGGQKRTRRKSLKHWGAVSRAVRATTVMNQHRITVGRLHQFDTHNFDFDHSNHRPAYRWEFDEESQVWQEVNRDDPAGICCCPHSENSTHHERLFFFGSLHKEFLFNYVRMSLLLIAVYVGCFTIAFGGAVVQYLNNDDPEGGGHHPHHHDNGTFTPTLPVLVGAGAGGNEAESSKYYMLQQWVVPGLIYVVAFIPVLVHDSLLPDIVAKIVQTTKIEQMIDVKHVQRVLGMMKAKKALMVLHNMSSFMHHIDEAANEARKMAHKSVRNMRMLKNCSKEQIEALLEHCCPHTFLKRDIIVAKGQYSSSMFIVVSGQAAVLHTDVDDREEGTDEAAGGGAGDGGSIGGGGGAGAGGGGGETGGIDGSPGDERKGPGQVRSPSGSSQRRQIGKTVRMATSTEQIIETGQVFGEVAMINGEMSEATVVCSSHKCVVFEISHETAMEHLPVATMEQLRQRANGAGDEIGEAKGQEIPSPVQRASDRRSSSPFVGVFAGSRGRMPAKKRHRHHKSALEMLRELAMHSTFRAIDGDDSGTVDPVEMTEFFTHLFPKDHPNHAFHADQIRVSVVVSGRAVCVSFLLCPHGCASIVPVADGLGGFLGFFFPSVVCVCVYVILSGTDDVHTYIHTTGLVQRDRQGRRRRGVGKGVPRVHDAHHRARGDADRA